MHRRQKFILFLTVFIDLVGFGMIIPLNPYLARQFGADPLMVGLLMSIYSLMQFVFSPFWGRISDQVGRRPVLILSLLGAGVSHCAFALADSYWGLFLARAMAGVMAANIGTAMAAMADLSDEKSRTQSMGLIGAAFGLGFMLGPFFGSVAVHVGELLGTRPPLGASFAALLAGAICLANAVFAAFVLRESRPDPAILARTDRLTLSHAQRLRTMARFLWRPGVGRYLIMTFFSVTAMGLMEAPLFMLVQDKLGWSLQKAGLGFAYVGLIMVITQGFLLRRLSPRLGEKRLLLVGSVCAAIGYLGIAGAEAVPPLAAAVTLLAVGAGLISPSINGGLSLITRAQDQGLALGSNQSLSALGRVTGPAVGGFLYKAVGSWAPFATAAALSLIVFTLAWRLQRPRSSLSSGATTSTIDPAPSGS